MVSYPQEPNGAKLRWRSVVLYEHADVVRVLRWPEFVPWDRFDLPPYPEAPPESVNVKLLTDRLLIVQSL
jgi:hypothetical protein